MLCYGEVSLFMVMSGDGKVTSVTVVYSNGAVSSGCVLMRNCLVWCRPVM